MTIYIVLLGALGVLTFFCKDIKDQKIKKNLLFVFICIAIILIQGLRSNQVGVDLSGYIPAYKESVNYNFLNGDKLLNYELGYSLMNKFLATIHVSEPLFLTIVAAIIIIPICYIWSKYSNSISTSAFIYITLGFFSFSFSGLRQAIAIAITFFSFKYIKEKKWIKFVLLVVLASLFHVSALVFLLAYPLYYIKIKPVHYIFIIPLLVLVFILKSEIYSLFIYLYRGYEGVPERTGAYTMLFVMACVLFLSFLAVSKSDELKENNQINALRNYLLVAIFFQLFASVSNTVMRAGFYYFIFITILIPLVVSCQKNYKIRFIANSCVVIALVYFYYVQTLSSGYLQVVPYHFFWQ